MKTILYYIIRGSLTFALLLCVVASVLVASCVCIAPLLLCSYYRSAWYLLLYIPVGLFMLAVRLKAEIMIEEGIEDKENDQQ